MTIARYKCLRLLNKDGPLFRWVFVVISVATVCSAMLLLRCLLSCLPLLPLTSAWGGDHANGGLPQVDLGYEIHQAISYNVRPCPSTDNRRTDNSRKLDKPTISQTLDTPSLQWVIFVLQHQCHRPVETLKSRTAASREYVHRLHQLGTSSQPSMLPISQPETRPVSTIPRLRSSFKHSSRVAAPRLRQLQASPRTVSFSM